MKIVLLGYMGSGKTAMGRMLARQANLAFVDLDHYIEPSPRFSTGTAKAVSARSSRSTCGK